MSDFILSVCVRSYNQKDYLRIALDSILSQITNFKYEIIVSDDCSTDGSIEMLHEYAELYPDKIRLVLGDHNIGGPNNFKRVIESSKAKYVAFMDGDDYWVDNFKLQKQYDFMETHPEYIGCFHNAYTISDGADNQVRLFNNSFFSNPVTYRPIITERWFMPTSSEFVRRDRIIFPEWYCEVANDDYVINLGLALSGDFYYMPDVMSAYRYHADNISRIYRDITVQCTNFIRIYTEYSKVYPTEALPLLNNQITKFSQLLDFHKRIQEHPWLRYFDYKTYKRAIKHQLIRLVAANGMGGGKITPLLSVCVRSHNQEHFISEALECVLMQITDFNFDIIISDDCSTDGTVEILKQYKEQYPDKIKLILGETNIGGPANLKRVIEASNAKYITCLDGDDFYTDEYKLQKQVDFLETNMEYAACFHNTWYADSEGNLKGLFNRPDFHAVHDAREFIRERWFVPIHSAVLRREYIEFPDWYNTVMNDDYVVHLSVAKHAPYYFMPDVMVAYRRHSENTSIAYQDLILTDTKLCAVLENMKPLYPEDYAPDFDARIAKYKAEIANLQLLQKYPWCKWLRRKTYKHFFKQWLKKYV